MTQILQSQATLEILLAEYQWRITRWMQVYGNSQVKTGSIN